MFWVARTDVSIANVCSMRGVPAVLPSLAGVNAKRLRCMKEGRHCTHI